MAADEVMIHFCRRLVEVPANRKLRMYTPRLELKGSEDPVLQVVRAAMAEHRAGNRPTPREVWVWSSFVYVPQEGEDGENKD